MFNHQSKLRGDVSIVLIDKDGNIKDKQEMKNLLVDAGLEFTCSRMAGTSASVMSHMGVGSGTTAAAAGQTDLVSLLGSRKSLDSATASNNSITYVCTFGPGEGTGAITESAIFNAATGGTMLARVTFAVMNKAAADSLVITHSVSLSAA